MPLLEKIIGKGIDPDHIFAMFVINQSTSTSIPYAVAKFIVLYWGDKVDYGIGLSYRPASLCSLTGRYDMSMS
jgi:hypothetical protein